MIAVVDEDDITTIAPLSIDDLTRTVPNVDFGGGPRYLGEQLIVRGEDGSAVTVRIDDSRQNFVSGHSGQRFFVETDFLKSIEILAGGGSFLYGSGSAGVISLTTLDPEDLIPEDSLYGFRLRDTFQANADEWSHSLLGAVGNDTVKVMAGFSTRDGNEITLANGVELPFSSVERESAIGKLVFTPDDETRFEFGITDYTSIDQGGANPQALTVASDNALVNRKIQYTQFLADYAWNPEFNDWIDLKSTFYHNTTNQTRNYADVTGANANRVNVHDLDVSGIDFNNRSVFSGPNGVEHEMILGIDYFFEEQDGQETRGAFFVPGAAPGNASGRPDAKGSHFGVYLTDEIDLTDSLTVFAGLRFDTYSTESAVGSSLSQSDSAVLPQIGFDYDVGEQLSFFGQATKGFTAPTLNDLYQEGSHFGPVGGGTFTFEKFFIPNPNLKPEESDNFELGLHFEDEDFMGTGGRFSARTSGFVKNGRNTFDTDVIDSQTTVTVIPGGFGPPTVLVTQNDFRQTVNREETEIYGFEFTADYDADFWFAGLDIGVLRGKDTTTNLNLNSITGDQVALNLGIRPFERLELSARGIWNSGREDFVNDATLKTAGA